VLIQELECSSRSHMEFIGGRIELSSRSGMELIKLTGAAASWEVQLAP
jgi:hypothetical protein